MTEVGRPTDYTPEMCDIIDGLGSEGEGMAEAWDALGISRQTFYDWQKAHPEFLDAVNAMKGRSQAWWERKGRIATFNNEGFNATAFIFNMKNRFREDWNDKTMTELTGASGGPIETKDTTAADVLKARLDAISGRAAGEPSES